MIDNNKKKNSVVGHSKLWRLKNPEKHKLQKERYFLKHKKEIYERTKLWRKNNPDKIKKYRESYSLKHPYKIEEKNFRTKIYLRGIVLSMNEFNRLLEKQNRVCAICSKVESQQTKKGTIRALSIDHCHKTKKVRGLLCKKCNSGIGFFQDNPILIKKAYKYLMEYDK